MNTQSNTDLLNTLNPVIEIAKEMLLAGTLTKNVIRHFTNKGFAYDAAENIAALGNFEANNFKK